MAALVGALAALDRHSLATKRPITVPMLRGWLQNDYRPPTADRCDRLVRPFWPVMSTDAGRRPLTAATPDLRVVYPL